MGRRDRKKETLERLNFKALDAKFIQEIQYGLNCSPFECLFLSVAASHSMLLLTQIIRDF